jgi:hypothetical protein
VVATITRAAAARAAAITITTRNGNDHGFW